MHRRARTPDEIKQEFGLVPSFAFGPPTLTSALGWNNSPLVGVAQAASATRNYTIFKIKIKIKIKLNLKQLNN